MDIFVSFSTKNVPEISKVHAHFFARPSGRLSTTRFQSHACIPTPDVIWSGAHIVIPFQPAGLPTIHPAVSHCLASPQIHLDPVAVGSSERGPLRIRMTASTSRPPPLARPRDPPPGTFPATVRSRPPWSHGSRPWPSLLVPPSPLPR